VKEILLFTDGSVNVQTNIGFGAFLIVEDSTQSVDDLKSLAKVKRFENTSSSKLELQILLWALNKIEINKRKVVIYTDSQNIIGLPERRVRLELNDYRSKKGVRIKNYKLYQEFFKICDELEYELVKVRGHQQSRHKDYIHKIFKPLFSMYCGLV
jgi:ribonuclease HI